MSISGMISIRALLIGTGELLRLLPYILFGNEVVSVPQRAEHQNHVVARGLEFELKPCYSRVIKVEKNQSKDRDTQPASRCDKRLGYAAAHFCRRQISVADKIERTHDTGHRSEQAEKWGKSNCRIHYRHKSPGPLNFDPGSNLQSAFNRGVNMV